MKTYQVVCGNIGTVYAGSSLREALATYWDSVEASQEDYGRGAGEPVTLLEGDKILKEYRGKHD